MAAASQGRNMPDEYSVDLYHHLRRARNQLDRGKHDGLFYAAFELRCGVESRIQDYLDAREDIAKKKKKGWKVAAAGRELDKAFADGLRIIELVIVSPATGEQVPFFHTPVGPELRTATGRLGDLLHAQKETISGDSQWWSETRKFLEYTFKMAGALAQGTLLAPLLQSPTGQISMQAYYHKDNPIAAAFHDKSPFTKGAKMEVRVAYHDEMPPHAGPYLNHWKPPAT